MCLLAVGGQVAGHRVSQCPQLQTGLMETEGKGLINIDSLVLPEAIGKAPASAVGLLRGYRLSLTNA
jgi:hypothetical protein